MHTLILGFDSFDPATFERLVSQGKLPNLARFVQAGQYARFTVSDPPQTEVSWTSIATGLDPGGHGIFDFVHRDPATYTPFISLLPTQRNILGVQFVTPYQARSLFEEATRLGYPATSLWWPGTFPARYESPVRTIPGLGTPDLLGRLGVGMLYTTDPSQAMPEQKTPVKAFQPVGRDRYTSSVEGPLAKKDGGTQAAMIDLQLELVDEETARLAIGKQVITLKVGQWSPIFEIPFKMGLFMSVRGLAKVILTHIRPDIRLYFAPLQIHPLASPWRYATPPSFAKQAWKAAGPYLTLGWPQDTTGLEDGCISDSQFLDLCDSIFAHRERLLIHLLDTFQEGVLAAIFDSLDRVQHMFRRDRPDIIENWYVKLDGLVGRIEERLVKPGRQKAQLIVLSDHGFAEFQHKVHLNRWLVDNGYLIVNTGNGSGSLADVNWSRSQAYAVGLNSLYINLVGREGQGCVTPDQYKPLAAQLQERLEAWRGPDDRPVAQRILPREQAFSGPLTPFGPDLLVGYTPGYRASAETGLGKWKETSLETNQDHWGADHCIDSRAVPGVIFSNRGLDGLSSPSYRDVPRLAIGKDIEPAHGAPPPPHSTTGGEDQEILEERLKSLGYL